MTPEDIDSTFVPQPRSCVAAAELDGELVLLDEATWSMHRLNGVASIVWNRFDGAASIDDLVTELAAAFGEDRSTVDAAIVGLVRQLAGQHLLEGVRGDAPVDAGLQPADHGSGMAAG